MTGIEGHSNVRLERDDYEPLPEPAQESAAAAPCHWLARLLG